ncbi:MAG: tRNA dimethylallyltransferase [Bacteroidetes bacterium]|nr:tRNA dimethylallyltransferase [Bacteroidota bacterium]
MQSEKKLIVILGPTAVGKTALAIEVAKALGTEIISADSRQFFREMNIGTAKPSAEELKQVKHHFINSLSVTDDYNVGMFERDALQVLEKILAPPHPSPLGREKVIQVLPQWGRSACPNRSIGGGGKGFRRGQRIQEGVAVMVGGSGLYINAVLNGFDPVPQADKELRANLTALYKEYGIEELQQQLKRLDPEHYRKVDIKNPHRLIRAIEVCLITGKPYSEFRKKDSSPNGGGRADDSISPDRSVREGALFTPIKIGLELGREELYARINARVDKMMSDGLVEEVKKLKAHRHRNSLHTVGYKEVFDFFEGKQDLSRTVELIKQNTRNYAKRQMTWFRKDKEIKWFSPHDSKAVIEFVKKELESKK